MAPFNPGIPNIDPKEYLNYSRPISDIPVDKSAGQLIASLGDMAQAGFKLGDKLIKDKIQADIYEKVDPVRDDFNNALSAERQRLLNSGASLSASVDPDSEGPDGDRLPVNARPVEQKPLNLLPENIPPPTPGIQAGIEAVSTIENARRNNQGNLSMTYYDAKLDSIAKEMRSKWPMYREYIDQQISSITGVNPANALIRSSMSDINKLIQSQGSAEAKMKNAVITMGKDFGEEGAKIAVAVSRGLMPADVGYYKLTAMGETKFQVEQLQLRQTVRDLTDKNYTNDAEADFTQIGNKIVTGYMDNSAPVAGMTGFNVMEDWADGVRSGRIKPDDEQARIYAGQADSQIEKIRQQLRLEANKSYRPGQKTYAQALSPEALDRRIEQALSPLVNRRNLLAEGKFALATAAKDSVTAQKNSGALMLWDNDPNGAVKQGAILTQLTGEQFASSFFSRTNFTNLTSSLNQLAKNETVKAFLNGRRNYSNQDYTISDTLKRAGVIQDENGINPINNPNYVREVWNIPNEVLNPETPNVIKSGVIKYGFSRDSIAEFAKLPQGGVIVGNKRMGQLDIFTQYTSPQYAAEVKKLNDPIANSLYTQWTAGVTTLSFRPIIQQLNSAMEQGNQNKGWRIGYDSDNHRFIVDYDKTVPGMQRGRIDQIINSANRLVTGMKNVNTTINEKSDPNAFVMKLFTDNGYNPKNSVAAANVFKANGFTPTSKSAEQLPSDRAFQFSDDTRSPPSVADFVANPIGGRTPAEKIPVPKNTNLTGPGKSSEVISIEDIPPGMEINDFLRMQRNRRP